MKPAAAAAAALFLVRFPVPAAAQNQPSGQASVLAAAYAHEARSPELRPRIQVKDTFTIGPHVRFDAGGFAEGLLADGGLHDGVIEADDVAVQVNAARFDLRAGYTRAVWGRLDEIQPSDVVNPQDLSRFFMEGREAARMPVGMIRGRVHFTESSTLEIVVVPRFRAGRFDRLDERSSPFNPTLPAALPAARRPSGSLWERMQKGGRFTASTGRVDWAIGAYRGFRPLPVYSVEIGAAPGFEFSFGGIYPRFTMASADFETAFSRWGLRGEAVVTREDAIQASDSALTLAGRTIHAGIGADRSVAGFRLLGELVVRTVRMDEIDPAMALLFFIRPQFDRRSISAVVITERRFARDTRLLRAFGVYDATAHNGVLRGSGAFSVREGIWIEGTAGWFAGRRTGLLGPFVDSDFVFASLRKDF